MKFPPLNEQLDLIRRGAVDLINEEELARKIEKSLATGKQLVVKLGADPSTPDLHIGHGVVLRKLRAFQDLGHLAVLIIGDFTAMIGDPSGRQKTRPMLTVEEVSKNAETYTAQAAKILDIGISLPSLQRVGGEIRSPKLQVLKNSTWLNPMSFADVIKLAGTYTVSQMLEREDFHKRFNEELPISLHEFLYPLAQGMDSVKIKSDIELGGTDQKFNLLVGRELQKHYGHQPQSVLTMPLLEGTDGNKMSKSAGNSINFSDSQDDMFGKTMSISDKLIFKYFQLATDVQDLEKIREELNDPATNPRNLKVRLAKEIVTSFYGQQAAEDAYDRFHTMFVMKQAPKDIEEVPELSPEPKNLIDIILNLGLVTSKSEARRLMQGGGVTVDGVKMTEPQTTLSPTIAGNVIRVGKRKHIKYYLKSDFKIVAASTSKADIVGILAIIRHEDSIKTERFIIDGQTGKARWKDSILINDPTFTMPLNFEEGLAQLHDHIQSILSDTEFPTFKNLPKEALHDFMRIDSWRAALLQIMEKTESQVLSEYIKFYHDFGISQGWWTK